jgi:pimeloyl-ACP methyl ester carboxylesterase
LLLLGGGLSTGEAAFQRILELEGQLRVISPSYAPVGEMALLTDGLAAILDAEGIQRAHVFGHSLGAAVAHSLVRHHPDRVDKLALSAFGIYNERNARALKRLVRLFAFLPKGALRAFYMPRFRRLLEGADDDERAFILAYMDDVIWLQHTKATLLGQFKLLVDLIEHPEANHVFAPVTRPGRVLIIAADDDKGFQAPEREMLASLYPEAQVHIFGSGGHWVGVTRQKEYNRVLYDFLRIRNDEGEP